MSIGFVLYRTSISYSLDLNKVDFLSILKKQQQYLFGHKTKKNYKEIHLKISISIYNQVYNSTYKPHKYFEIKYIFKRHEENFDKILIRSVVMTCNVKKRKKRNYT